MYIAIFRYKGGVFGSGDDIISILKNKDELIEYMKDKLSIGRTSDDFSIYEAKELKVKKMNKIIPEPIYEIEI